MTRIALCLLVLGAALAGCRAGAPAEPDAPEQAVRRPPEPACARARAALDRQSRDATLMFEESGEAMIDRRAWLRLDESGRDQLVERLAVVAGCAAATPQREVEIVIRSDTGDVLARRRVEPSIDFRTGAE